MKNFLPFGIIAACFLISCHNSENKEQGLSQLLSTGKFIDLSYDFSPQTLYWPNNPTGFVMDTLVDGTTAAGFPPNNLFVNASTWYKFNFTSLGFTVKLQ